VGRQWAGNLLSRDGRITVIDPAVEWTIDPAQFQSKSRNCPFAGWKVRGRAHLVLVGGMVRFEGGRVV